MTAREAEEAPAGAGTRPEVRRAVEVPQPLPPWSFKWPKLLSKPGEQPVSGIDQ